MHICVYVCSSAVSGQSGSELPLAAYRATKERTEVDSGQ